MGNNEFSPGDLIADKYRVVRTIGRGGMGVVLAADHLHLGKPVAVKVLRGDANQVSLARFSREARAVAQITNPHVCQVYDVGVLPNGDPFMVMELLEGADLAEVAKGNRGFAINEVVDYILQACEALAEAHTKDIVHRDLKPGNLFLSVQPDGSRVVKLLDFGISKSMTGPDQGLTQTDAVVGSPRFMAPEQLKSAKQVDQRADIWSLGVMMHELLTGKTAFLGGTIAELFISIIQEQPEPLLKLRPDAPAGLAQVIDRCLEKDRDDRYANVAELALALGPYGSPTAQSSCDTITGIYKAVGWSRSEPEPKQTHSDLMSTVAISDDEGIDTVARVAAAVSQASAGAPAAAPAAALPAGYGSVGGAPAAVAAPAAVTAATGNQPVVATTPPGLSASPAFGSSQTTDGVAGAPHPSGGGALVPVLAASGGLAILGAVGLAWWLTSAAPADGRGDTAPAGGTESSAAPAEPTAEPPEGPATTAPDEAASAEPVPSATPSVAASASAVSVTEPPPPRPVRPPPTARPPAPTAPKPTATKKDRIGF